MVYSNRRAHLVTLRSDVFEKHHFLGLYMPIYGPYEEAQSRSNTVAVGFSFEIKLHRHHEQSKKKKNEILHLFCNFELFP